MAMGQRSKSWRSRFLAVSFAATFVATSALAVALAFHPTWREAASIILFLPLIWSFVRLRPSGMIVAGAVLAAVRVAVETAQLELGGGYNAFRVTRESFFPVCLYVALGVAFYLYRRRQEQLTGRLAAARALEAREQLASSLAHDFNNVLTVVNGMAAALSKNKDLDAQTLSDVTSILRASEQGISLVAEMTGMTRGRPTQVAVHDLSALVDQQLGLIERVMPECIKIEHNLAEKPLPVRLDPGQLLRVLTNLCFNARDAMPEGGKLTVATSCRLDGPGPMAVITIADTGVGISKKNLRRIFEPFFTTRTSRGGTGLGLSIVQSLVAAHNGRVEVASTPGVGTTFTILLPLQS